MNTICPDNCDEKEVHSVDLKPTEAETPAAPIQHAYQMHKQEKAGIGGTVAAWVLAAAVVGGGVYGVMKLLPKAEAAITKSESGTGELRRVSTVSAHLADATTTVSLPAGTQALRETTLYARVDGYVTKVLADIGDHVKAGQVLAEIDSPETDQGLLQANANLEKAKANADLSQSMLNRVATAHKAGAANQQELDQQQAQVNVDIASVKVADAEVTRLAILKEYERVIAPFDGIVTQRAFDPGALITSGSGSQLTSLFRISQYGTLRVFVDVPQSVMPSVKLDQPVQVAFKEYPGKTFSGKVARLNGSLDAFSRTRSVEVHVDNPNNQLLPGEYVQVQFAVTSEKPPFVVPAGALVIGREGTRVLKVSPNGRLEYAIVELGRDFGKEAEVVHGLTGSDRLVMNPTDDLKDGQEVQIEPTEVAAAR